MGGCLSEEILFVLLMGEIAFYMRTIDHFIVVCSVTWPLNGSKSRGDLVKPRSHIWLSGFLICLRFIKPRIYCSAFGFFLNRAAVYCSAFGFFFFLVLSVTNPRLPRMMSSSANDRPFLSSFRHIPPQESFV